MRMLFITLLLLSACSLGDHPQIVTYTVSSSATRPQSSCHGKLSLQITEPTSVAGLDSPRIAVIEGGQRITYYSGVKWAAPVAEMLRNVMIDSFEKNKAFAAVSTESEAAQADMQLSTDIRNFEVTDTTSGNIHIRLVAKLIDIKTRKILATIPLEKTAKPAAYKMEAIVAAFNTNTADIVGEMIAKSAVISPKCKD